MKFEYNLEKSETNRRKHGITLEEAKGLWAAPNVQLEANVAGELRFMIIGKLNHKFYSCIFTPREEKIRLISARRSRPKEERIYHENISQEEIDSEGI